MVLRSSAVGKAGVSAGKLAIWTPSWVLFSGGWCFLLLAAFYVLVDMWGKKKWAFPFVVIGVNSITAYCVAHLFQAWAFNSFRRLFGREVFAMFGAAYEPLVYGGVVLLFLWSVLFGMYRGKLFVRI